MAVSEGDRLVFAQFVLLDELEERERKLHEEEADVFAFEELEEWYEQEQDKLRRLIEVHYRDLW
jgi:hypothetical protein